MDDLLTTRQLQALLHVDRITIYRMLGDGRLAGFKVGGQWRFSRREIESWLRQQQDVLPAADETLPGNSSREDAASPALPLTCVQSIQSICADSLDVASVTVDNAGAPITEVSNSCEFCSLILATELGRQRCAAAWRAASQAGHGERPFQTCHAGLLVAAAPVQVGGQRVASAVTCQFTARPWQADVATLAADLKVPTAKLQSATASVRTVPESFLPRIVKVLGKTAGAYAKIGQERLDLVGRLRRIAEITNL